MTLSEKYCYPIPRAENHEIYKRYRELAEVGTDGLLALPASELGWIAPRPAYSALTSDRGCLFSCLDVALSRYHEERGR
jgi:dTDP-4-dehydrorhamnose reductase